jgi:kinesin family protein 3/17
VKKILQKGSQSRATASTKLNDISSRSHAIFQVQVEQKLEKQKKLSFINFVDLAGSERAKVSGAKGIRLEECKKIN